MRTLGLFHTLREPILLEVRQSFQADSVLRTKVTCATQSPRKPRQGRHIFASGTNSLESVPATGGLWKNTKAPERRHSGA
jgi:hypothetical protein